MASENNKKRSIRGTIILILVFAAGLGILLYPTFSDWWNSFHQSRLIVNYVKTVSSLDEEDYDRMLAEAENYNLLLQTKPDRFHFSEEEAAEYNRLLDITGTGIMGYVEIPSLDLSLPVYHGTNEAVLQSAIGHIEGTSLPVGGAGTHAAISGHRGLPSAKLFTDIDQMKTGDMFRIQVLDRTLTYKVDQILTVLPNEMESLAIDPEQDYCTLITCTPYGINSHRLLVRGKRIPTEEYQADIVTEAHRIDPKLVAPLVAAPFLLAVIILIIIEAGRKAKTRKTERNSDTENT